MQKPGAYGARTPATCGFSSVALHNRAGRARPGLPDSQNGAKRLTPMIDYIQKGGLLMWPILACSIVAIAVFRERCFNLPRPPIPVGNFLKGLSILAQRRNFAEAFHEPAGTPGPVARVTHAPSSATTCRGRNSARS